MRAHQAFEERAARREAALEKRLMDLSRELGGVKYELEVAQRLNADYRERLERKTKAINGALEAREAHDTEHDSLNGKSPDPHLSCVWESLEAVSS